MRFDAILYDMDGTLLDTEKLHKMAWVQAALPRGVIIDEEFFSRAMGRNLTYVLQLLRTLYPTIGDVDTLEQERTLLCLAQMELRGVPVLPGVHACLGAFGAAGIGQCVCTSTGRRSATHTLMRAGIAPKIDAMVCGDDITASKPEPDIFLMGAKLLSVDIARCAVIEDAPAGVEAGLRAGATVFTVPGLLPIPAQLARQTHPLSGLWELHDLLLGTEER